MQKNKAALKTKYKRNLFNHPGKNALQNHLNSALLFNQPCQFNKHANILKVQLF